MSGFAAVIRQFYCRFEAGWLGHLSSKLPVLLAQALSVLSLLAGNQALKMFGNVRLSGFAIASRLSAKLRLLCCYCAVSSKAQDQPGSQVSSAYDCLAYEPAS